ncbi:DUF1707 domain-containing protein [Embleya sp. NPDC005575]|uniref:DUF1707 SHOCT-like domain-containing protein n=1 Tax=Embleya sp. NPDC005575 TaxID=3156892 RepID=UPI0033B2F669
MTEDAQPALGPLGSPFSEPVCEVERDAAAGLLAEHYAMGTLEIEDLDRRLSAVFTADSVAALRRATAGLAVPATAATRADGTDDRPGGRTWSKRQERRGGHERHRWHGRPGRRGPASRDAWREDDGCGGRVLRRLRSDGGGPGRRYVLFALAAVLVGWALHLDRWAWVLLGAAILLAGRSRLHRHRVRRSG